MLYQEIVKKNNALEEKLFSGKNRTGTRSIEMFLDALVKAIPLIYSPRNYGRCLELFLKWETLLHSKFNKRYHGKVSYN